MIKAYFSEKPEKIRYMSATKGYVDIWLRTNIEEIKDTDPEGNEITSWSADENYFRAKEKNMPFKYVQDNFDELLTYEGDIISGSTLEERVSDIEAAIAELIGGVL